MSHVILELASTHVAILVNSYAMAVHFAVFEVTLVVRIVSPREFAFPVHIILIELTLVDLA
jgi:hypothetical protein